MASYRVVCEVVKGEIVFYEFDGCRNGRLYYGAEDYCTEKCGVWVIDATKANKITNNEYSRWREELNKFKVEEVA